MANLFTNCGEITPQTFEVCKFEEGADITHSQIPYFHRMMCNWAYNAALGFQWVIVINAHNRQYLLQRIKEVVPTLEPLGWNTADTVDETWTEATQDVIGCIFAQGVDLPGETMNVNKVGLTDSSNRGFINGTIINGRSNFTDLNVGFLETNRSFVDGVLRPWSILVSHEGLIARRRNESIKADIEVYELAKQGECTKNTIRKKTVFKDCAPIYISPEQKTYSSSSDFSKRQSNFTFNSYYITDLGEERVNSPAPAAVSSRPPQLINTTPLDQFILDDVRNLA